MKVEIFQWQIVAKRLIEDVPSIETAKAWAERGDFDKKFRFIPACYLDQSYKVLSFEGNKSKPERNLKCDFQPYDKVLVNKGKGCPWCLSFFSHYDLDSEHYPYTTLHGDHWMDCIPFEGNETKLGDLAE